ncbi:MAG: choice-of-anchor D domain-containing protein [Spirochaetes bacterium]|nr:choice-of-anchor D domain-containing protein [Spirochaetota bacterium]
MKIKSAYWIFVLIFSISYLTACGGGSSTSEGTSGAPKIAVSQTNIDFSGTVLNSLPESRTITVTNTGDANLIIGNISSPVSPFEISDDQCSNTTIRPNRSSSVTVRFSPTEANPFSGSFFIPSNDPYSSAVKVNLKGEGCGLDVHINQVDTLSCPNIYVDFTVTDQDGNLITDLTAADNFHIYINNFERAVEYNENSARDPISVILTLDYSSSLTANLSNIQTAAENFIKDYLTDTDEAAVCRFKSIIDYFPNYNPFFISTDSTGKAALTGYIYTTFSATDGTLLYDAIYYSVEMASYGLKDKVIILLSDGANTTVGAYDLDSAKNYAATMGIPIFSIYYVGTNGQPGIMQDLADDTNGKYYTTEGTYDLEDIFQQIRYVLTDKYTLLIPGINCDAESIELEVRVTSGGLTGVDKKILVLP